MAPEFSDPRLFQAILQSDRSKIDILIQDMQIRLETKDDWRAAIELGRKLCNILLITMGLRHGSPSR
jgi:hypothetical protein